MPSVVFRKVAEIAAGQHGVISRKQAVGAGATDSWVEWQVRRGGLIRVDHGIYRLPGSPRTPLQDIVVGVLAVGPEAVASHNTAAHLWDLLDKPSALLHVTTTRPRWRPKPYSVHRSTDLFGHHCTIRLGVPVTTPARTLVDLGATTGKRVTEIAFDHALRLGLVQIEDLEALVDEVGRQGRRGVGTARDLTRDRARWTGATESQLEDDFKRLMRRSGLPLPTPQFTVRDGRGAEVGRVDFAYPQRRIAIELDGYRFHSDAAAFVQDRRRQNELLMAGFTVLRYTVRDLCDWPERVVAEISAALR